MNICEQAETYRLLLLMGAVTVQEIVVWADKLIMGEDQPPAWLLDVSLAANDNAEKMQSLLRDLPCVGNKVIAAYTAIGTLAEKFESGKISASVAAHILAIWAANAKVGHADWTNAMIPIWIADEISYGYTTDAQVASAIGDFLEGIKQLGKK